MSFSKLTLLFCLSFIGGIFAASIIHPTKSLLLGLFIFGALFPAPFILGRRRFGLLCVLLIFFALGLWRYQAAEQKILDSPLLALNDFEQTITFIGTVAAEPDIRATNIKLTIKPSKIESDLTLDGTSLAGDGKILVTMGRYPEYVYGDKLRITGRLQTPTELEDFNYRDYLKKEGIYSVMYWPQVEYLGSRTDRSLTSIIYNWILGLKGKLRQAVYQNLSPPQSSILAAMMLGDKRKISDDWKEKLNIAGVRHITAISGMHVAILTIILMTILIGLGLWRQQAFYITLIATSLFIIMTGLQPSAVRAGIMAGLLLLAQHVGRLSDSSRVIVFAAAAMLFLNPFLLRLDVGFQLSFAAMMGIIYLSPMFANWFRNLTDVGGVKGILVITLSTYTFSAPILIYNFGQISLVGILANLLIVPWLWLVMVTGFLFAFAFILWQPLGWLLSWPAWLLLTYITKLVEWFSSVPFAAVIWQNAHWLWLAAGYTAIGFITWRSRQRVRFKFLGPG